MRKPSLSKAELLERLELELYAGSPDEAPRAGRIEFDGAKLISLVLEAQAESRSPGQDLGLERARKARSRYAAERRHLRVVS